MAGWVSLPSYYGVCGQVLSIEPNLVVRAIGSQPVTGSAPISPGLWGLDRIDQVRVCAEQCVLNQPVSACHPPPCMCVCVCLRTTDGPVGLCTIHRVQSRAWLLPGVCRPTSPATAPTTTAHCPARV
jgi:hypothetical protein